MLRAWWSWCVLVAAIWVLPRLAAAAPGEITIALESDGGPEAPGWVCAVSRGQGHDQDDTPWLESALRRAPLGQLSSGRAEELSRSLRALDWDTAESVETMAEVLRAMVPGGREPSCGGEAGQPQLCAAQLLPTTLKNRSVICTVNERQGGSLERVLWIEVSARDTRGAKAFVEELVLNGHVLTIGTNLRGRDAIKVVKAIGGHYLDGAEVRTAASDPITLSLESRCRWIGLEVPPIDLPTGGRGRPVFDLEHGGKTTRIAEACVRGSMRDQSLALRLPSNRRTSKAREAPTMRLVGTIEQELPATPTARVQSAAPAGSPHPRARAAAQEGKTHQVRAHEVTAESFDIPLGARWTEPWPSEPLYLEPEAVTFFWPRSACFYPEGCPSALVAGSVEPCEAKERINGCHYRCDVAQANVGIVGAEFAVPVEFTDVHHGVPQPQWGGTLNHLNQRFLRSVPPAERSVKVDLHAWRGDFQPGHKWMPTRQATVHETPDEVVHASGDEIHALILRRSTGDERRIEFSKKARNAYFLELPNLQCVQGESVTVRVEGEREFSTTELPFENGTVTVPHPMSLARVLYFGTGVTLGFTRVLSPSDARRAGSWGPALSVDLSLRLRPRLFARGWRFEVPRFAYMLATQPFFPLSAEPREPASTDLRRAYGRFMLGFVARTPQWKPLANVRISGSFGVLGSAGAPVLAENIELVGDVGFGLVPMAELVVAVSRRIELRGSPQLICLETFHRHQTDLRGVAEDAGQRARMCSVFVGAGIAGTW